MNIPKVKIEIYFEVDKSDIQRKEAFDYCLSLVELHRLILNLDNLSGWPETLMAAKIELNLYVIDNGKKHKISVDEDGVNEFIKMTNNDECIKRIRDIIGYTRLINERYVEGLIRRR